MTNTIETVDMAAFARARGASPQACAVIRQQPWDFRVDEQCPVEPSGEGEHLWLHIEKTGLNTGQIADWLAAAAQVRPRDVGFSGLKDRWAVTRQWFSLPWPIKSNAETLSPDAAHLPTGGSARILRQCRHTRKLKRGTHDRNVFVIVLREVHGLRSAIDVDLERIARVGVPNYFGPQRFGRDGRNLALARALFAGKRLRRDKRGFALSAARSFLFNSVLDARVRAHSWQTLVAGEAVMLDGSNSIFNAEGQEPTELQRRLAAFDVHPSGPLPGHSGGRAVITGAAAQLEHAILAVHQDLVDGLVAARVDASRRALRLAVPNLDWHWLDANTLQLQFGLSTGAFATSVLREVVNAHEAERCVL